MTRFAGQEPNEPVFDKSLPLRRFGLVDEVATVVPFLASRRGQLRDRRRVVGRRRATAGDRFLLDG